MLGPAAALVRNHASGNARSDGDRPSGKCRTSLADASTRRGVERRRFRCGAHNDGSALVLPAVVSDVDSRATNHRPSTATSTERSGAGSPRTTGNNPAPRVLDRRLEGASLSPRDEFVCSREHSLLGDRCHRPAGPATCRSSVGTGCLLAADASLMNVCSRHSPRSCTIRVRLTGYGATRSPQSIRQRSSNRAGISPVALAIASAREWRDTACQRRTRRVRHNLHGVNAVDLVGHCSPFIADVRLPGPFYC